MITYDSHTNSAELQHDALVLLLVGSFLGWMVLLMGVLFHASITYTPWPVLPFLTLLGAIIGADELRRRQRGKTAAWALIVGLFAAPALQIALYGPSQAAFAFMAIPIVATSVLVSSRAEFLVAAVASAWMIVATLAWHHAAGVLAIGETWQLTWSPVCVYALIAAIAHLNARNISIMVAWAIDSQRKDARRAERFHAQADQLAYALRELEYTNLQLRVLNAELGEARAAADAANQLKTRFIANISHDLRTPLTIILGHSQRALETPNAYGVALPPRLVDDARCVQQHAAHLLRLINDLLDVSRSEIDALELITEPLAPGPFLEQVFASVVESLPARDAVIWHLDLPAMLPDLQADPDRLRQVLLNLLNNAAKCTERGQIVLGAAFELPHVHVWVSDTGIGIPNDLQARMFAPFVTGDRRAGVGLGLCIARRLVELHGGTLTCESQVGRGTTFHILLPLPHLHPLPAARSSGNPPVLLLLSRHTQIPTAVLAISERQRLPLHRVGQESELAAALAELQPVSIICDMSDTAGEPWPLVEQVRAHPQLCRLPLITYSPAPNAPTALATGLTNLLVKPISSGALVQTAYTLSDPAAQGPVLIVDDDPEIRAFYHRLLADAFPHIPVVVAEHGAAALAQLATYTPRLVILDLMMPEIDGFAVLDQLRQNPATRRTPVLVLSGRVLGSADIERLNHYAVAMLTKRVHTAADLTDRLALLLNAGDALSQSASLLVKRAVVYIHQHYQEPISRQQIADALHISVRYLTRIFSAEVGLPLQEYLSRYRVSQARLLLETTSMPITAIALQVGFDDPNYFSRAFRKHVGVTPLAYRTTGAPTSAVLPRAA